MNDFVKGEYNVHVVSGSHWDREWRFTAVQSKLRLADLIDDLLDMLDEFKDYRCFHIDGGAIVLEDYISVRPENAERVRRMVAEGRLVQSNWYTLPETNIIAGEALIRNLLIGRRISDKLGGSMKSGYTATGYGQPSQLPQIYRGFGIGNALFYRGTNKHQTPPVFKWVGRDGSDLMVVRGFDETTRTNWFFYAYYPLALGKKCRDLSYDYKMEDHPVHMADETLYDTAFTMLNETVEFRKDRLDLIENYRNFRETFYPYAIGSILPALDLEDNMYPWPHLPELIAALNEVLDDTHIRQSSMDEMFAAIAAEVAGTDLHVEHGEMRYAGIEPGFNGLLGMTQSSRTRIKILNEECETALITVAEPLAAMAAALGARYPRPHLDEAWRSLLMNHAHDSVCGSAVDRAHDDMLYRFSETKTIADEVAKRSCQSLWKRIDHSGEIFDGGQVVTIFNVLPFARGGVYPLVVDLPVESDKEGFNMGLPSVGSAIRQNFDIVDENGVKVEYELLSCEANSMAIEIDSDANVNFPVERNRLLLRTELPGLGYKSLAIRPRAPEYVKNPVPGKSRGLIAQHGAILENEYLRVSIKPNGTFDLFDKENGRNFEQCHYFDDRGSIGNAHLDGRPVRDCAVTSLGCSSTITMTESNPLRGVFRIDLTMLIPAEGDASDRSAAMLAMPISSWLTLHKGSRRLEIRTRVDNRAKDHRLAVMFPTGMDTDTIAVETPFAVETRNFMWKQTGDNFEPHYAYQPMLGLIDMCDTRSGLAFMNKGLREYAVYDDPRRTVGLTLLRTHRAYMTAATVLTPAEKENYPGVQNPGVQEFEYALCPHSGDWQTGRSLLESQDYRASIRAIQGPAKKADLPATQSLFKIEPEGRVMLSALCQSEDGKSTTLRIWNTLDEPIDAKLGTSLPFRTAQISNLGEDETGAELVMREGRIELKLKAAQIATLKLKT
jgi:mannosylglycerate hydrolase